MPSQPLRALAPRLRDLVARPDTAADDRELLRRFSADRDEQAFAEIVRRHGPMVLHVCRRALHHTHDAEDVSQAAFLLLARKAGSVMWRDSVAGWLFQAAHRLCQKARVAAGRRARHEAKARPAGQASPVAELTVRELQDALDAEVSSLPDQYRAPIVLCCLEGRSRDEAAVSLGWTLAAVKDRLERGRERLRGRLARRGVLLGTALASGWLMEAPARALSPHATARAALLLTTGQATLAGLLPAPVAALAKGATTTMALTRVTVLAACLALAAGTVAGITQTKPGAEDKPAPKQPAKPADPTPAQPEAILLAGHRGAVNSVAFSRGHLLATGGADKAVLLWDLRTGREVRRLEHPDAVASVAFSPDGSLAAASPGKGGTLTLFDANGGKPLWRVTCNSGALAYSPDGRRVAAAVEARGTSISAVETGAGRMLFAFFAGGAGPATAVAFAPDGKILVLGDGTGTIYQLDGATGRSLGNWSIKAPVKSLVFLPDGARFAVATGGRDLHVIDLRTGKTDKGFAGKDPVQALAVSPDGSRLATASPDGSVILWSLAGKQERQFAAKGKVSAIAFSPDGLYLATAGPDGAVLWNLTRDEKPLPNIVLTASYLNAAWADLASDDGAKVYAAGRLLRADPARSVTFLSVKLKAKLATVDEKKLKQLVADLDADEFATRESATRNLEKLGAAAESALRSALTAGPSPEAKKRLDRLLEPLNRAKRELTADQLRDVRAVRVLEQVGTPETKKLLEALVKESARWWVAEAAKEAISRMAPREGKP